MKRKTELTLLLLLLVFENSCSANRIMSTQNQEGEQLESQSTPTLDNIGISSPEFGGNSYLMSELPISYSNNLSDILSTNDMVRSIEFILNDLSPNGLWYFIPQYNTFFVNNISSPSVNYYPALSDRAIAGYLWSPDGNALVIYYGVTWCFYNPIGIIRILDGVVLDPNFYSFPPGMCDINDAAWSRDSQSLNLFAYNSNERVLSIYTFDVQMSLISTISIPLDMEHPGFDVQALNHGFLIIWHNTDDITGNRLTTFLVYSTNTNQLDQIANFDEENIYDICGISPDSTEALIKSNPDDSFYILNLENGEYEWVFEVENGFVYTCYESSDRSTIGLQVSALRDGDSLFIIWDWRTMTYQSIEDIDQSWGWFTHLNGYLVERVNELGKPQFVVITPET
jgi:hypothetical protein